MSGGGTSRGSVRVDSWLWAVRLAKTRSQATAACRAGHVRVNGVRAKAATPAHLDDTVEARLGGRLRIVTVRRLIVKRVAAAAAAECLVDRSPAPPDLRAAGAFAKRDRGAGRPTKRDRRAIDRLRER
jgi:ribosome-associated heat shock protein Hsp15